MLRTLDIVLIVVMTAAATVTYTIKHQAENKLEDVRSLEAQIKLEEDTIDLLRADWSLLTQPNRLDRLVKAYDKDLQLVPTDPTQLVHPEELPMMKADVPPPEEKDSKGKKKAAPAVASRDGAATDEISTGSVAR
ncbi:hypothetical protein ASG39_02455 [Rhizobium sp. Leaf371]|uniref:cell division protein FtsL n=1 Tax=unclassified Rhizobium TaxID=2613769 RepID=UPI0007144B3A|nr:MULTISPECIES: hypothetical protein [unclassified Rhizobium]KQS72634.1 hypothetical protein ASG39_02455 [Rhizobium sp. Leaf371]TCM58611.1 hypothetical protein C8J36_101517 [Rhizobium sp. PP-F2F-G48]